MKVHLLMASLSSGGAEHQLTILANLLAARGCEVSIVTFSDISDHYSTDKTVNRIRLAEGKNNLIKLVHLWYYLLRVSTDNIIIYTQRNSCIALPPLLFRKGVNVICGERNLTSGKPTIYETLLCSALYRRANYIVTNSHSQEVYLRSKYPWLSNKIKTIINYTDLNLFAPSTRQINTVRKIGVFARIDSQKNCLAFAKAVKKAKEQLDEPFQVLWYGNRYNGTQLSPEYITLNDYINEQQLSETFIICDPVKNPIIQMNNLDIICLPSLYEGFSNSIAEAICAGKPMIVSNVSDNSLMVVNKYNGFLFDPHNVNDMSLCIKEILCLSDEELIIMGQNSRKKAEELFDKESFLNSYFSVLK